MPSSFYHRYMLIINADDFGLCPEATDKALQCWHAGRIS